MSSLPYLVKSLFSQESHIEFILLACVLVTERLEGQKPSLVPPHPHPSLPLPRWGPLLLLAVAFRRAHRWRCCCSACWPSSPTPFLPPPGALPLSPALSCLIVIPPTSLLLFPSSN